MVAGLEDVTSGTIRLDGKVVNDLSAKDRDVAMVFQNYALYPHMNVLENIAFSLRVRGVPKQERERKAREAADDPRALGGGAPEARASSRAASASASPWGGRSSASRPCSSWTSRSRTSTPTCASRCAARCCASSGGSASATLYVTHDQTEAMTMGDRVAVLRGGTLQQLAAPQELYEQPANLFVASFIGSPAMNLYEATVSGPADRLVLSLGSQQLALPADLAGAAPASLPRTQARGRDPARASDRGSSGDGAEAARESTLSVRAELVEALGNESLLHFSTDARTVRNRGGVFTADPDVHTSGEIAGASATESVARVDPRVRIAVGDQVTLAVDVDRLHFFDAETGDAIRAVDASPAVPLQAGQS